MEIVKKAFQRMDSSPAALAVIGNDGKRITYGELALQVSAFRRLLSSHGVQQGDVVAVMAIQDAVLPSAVIGILSKKAVYVPLDPLWPAERIASIVKDVGPKVILNLSGEECTCEFAHVINDVSLTLIEGEKLDLDLSDEAYSGPACIFYTSGTTGTPKGVVLDFDNLEFYLASSSEKYRFAEGDVQLSVAKPTFSISLFDLLLPFYSGSALRFVSRDLLMNPQRLADAVSGVTAFHMGPALLSTLIRYAEANQITFPNLRHLSSGGDLIPTDLLESSKSICPNAEIWVIYGCTEVACMALTWQVPLDRKVSQTLVGTPFDGVDIRLLGENNCAVSVGEVGEVLISGAGVTKGYLNRDGLNQEKFISFDGRRFYKTGDQAVVGECGNFRLLGRADFQVKINGIRIEVEEIEFWIKSIAGVNAAVVVGANNARNEKKLVAFVVQNASEALNGRVIQDFIGNQLPAYMVPSKIVFLPAIPLNQNGKVDRKSLMGKAQEELSKVVTLIGAGNVESELASLWQKSGVSCSSTKSNFFEEGGDSLAAAILSYEMSQHFNCGVELDHIYQFPRLVDQVSLIERFDELGGTVEIRSLVRSLNVPRIASRNLFVITGMGGHPASFHNFGECFSSDWNVLALVNPILANEQHDSIESIASRLAEEVLRVQPEGEYYVAGYSLGGIIALELARVLCEAGARVNIVFLEARIYSFAPRKNLFMVGLIYLDVIMKQLLSRWSNRRALEDQLFSEPDGQSKSSRSAEKLLPPRFRKALAVGRRLTGNYRYSSCPVSAVLLRCTEQDHPWRNRLRRFSEDFGWRQLVNLVDIDWVPGNHFSMIKNPANLPMLAKKIEKACDLLRDSGGLGADQLDASRPINKVIKKREEEGDSMRGGVKAGSDRVAAASK